MKITRRNVIKSASGLAAAGVSGMALGAANPSAKLPDDAKMFTGVSRRAQECYVRRARAASATTWDMFDLAAQPLNSDEANLPEYVGNFSKTLPHDDLGHVDPAAYVALVNALDTADMSAVTLSPQAERKLANPSAFGAFDLHGGDGHATRIIAAPGLQSAHAAAEMIEVYWQALTRDIPFQDYASSSIIADAVAELNTLTHAVGPANHGELTPATIFRGGTFGDADGPYISQFLMQPFQYGAGKVVQRYRQPVVGLDFVNEFSEYLAIQKGANPTRAKQLEDKRYIQTNRDLANYVHNDVLFQAYYNAAMIMLGHGGLVATNTPYASSAAEAGFVTFGGPDILNMVSSAARMALTGAWYQKWLQRKLRPEAFGARVDVQRRNLFDYGLHTDVMNSAAVDTTIALQGNALLSQAYPEGSPTHPSYPAGHACVAGACATVLKAWFNEDAEIPNPVVPSADGRALNRWEGSPLTVRGEINKLANNISIGRNAAGVHYRSDGEQGMLSGEQQAIGLLRDYTFAYTDEFEGFTLTRFNGTRIRIANGKVEAA